MCAFSRMKSIRHRQQLVCASHCGIRLYRMAARLCRDFVVRFWQARKWSSQHGTDRVILLFNPLDYQWFMKVSVGMRRWSQTIGITAFLGDLRCYWTYMHQLKPIEQSQVTTFTFFVIAGRVCHSWSALISSASYGSDCSRIYSFLPS